MFGSDDQGTLESIFMAPKAPAVIPDLHDVDDSHVLYGDFLLPEEAPCMSSFWPPSPILAPTNPTATSSTSSSVNVSSLLALSPDSCHPAALDGNGGALEQSEALFSTASTEMLLQKPPDEAEVVAEAPAGDAASAAAACCRAFDCMDEMESFGYLGPLESHDLFDPTMIFHPENPFNEEVSNMAWFGLENEDQMHAVELQQQQEQEEEGEVVLDVECNDLGGLEIGDEMRAVFLEWLEANKDRISAEELRKVKIKKSTIHAAARRLGGGIEAMKQLLKLILEWVQTNYINHKHNVESSSANSNPDQQLIQPSPSPNPNPNFGLAEPAFPAFTDFPNASDPIFASQWAPLLPACVPPGMDQSPQGIGTFLGNELMDFHMMDPMQPWLPPIQWPQYEYTDTFHPSLGSLQVYGGSGYGYNPPNPSQYFNSGGSSRLKFARLGPTATKEARKNRMARQKRSMSSQHHRINNSRRQDGSYHKVMADQGGGIIGSDSYGADPIPFDCVDEWINWPSDGQGSSAAGEQLQVNAVEKPDMQHPPLIAPQSVPAGMPDKAKSSRSESNLRFLLQKLLKQSDVGNLGRIVLPKKEAEAHLPELEARDGISLSMEDIGGSKVWNMRYRYWPNNKSRMYVLENTGDFVRANGLKEGDFIVIYLDVETGKYLIRGVKVRRSGGTH
ncbi:hypothetical protein MLD38_025155 [Melastoma candidum]|uniref:Uncharacterized protein n=1 Tax=Melastoma candidum TaxID=119954 RepID=A0ACB9NVG2_9MYRT|nr:hypothetical protein MLD38_025155 [Melastoma candidum]